MTRSISHEIRTPLNTAFMALELLVSTLAQQQQAEHMSAKLLTSHSLDTVLEGKSEKVKGPSSASTTPKGSYHISNSSKVSGHTSVNSMAPGNSFHTTSTTYLLEIAESIKEGCDIALNILNQLLTFEKLSAGMLQLENKVLSVHQLIESNMKLFRMQAQQCGITFKLDNTTVDLDRLHVYVDEHKMNQVIRNLLSNAMKFTPRGGVVQIKLQWIASDERDDALEQLVAMSQGRNGSTISEEMSKSVSSHHLLTHQMRGSIKMMTKLIRMQSTVEDSVVPVTLQSHVPAHHPITGLKAFGTLLISVVDSGPGVSEVSRYVC